MNLKKKRKKTWVKVQWLWSVWPCQTVINTACNKSCKHVWLYKCSFVLHIWGMLWVIKWIVLGNTALLIVWSKLGFSCTGQILHSSGKADQDKMVQSDMCPLSSVWVKNIPQNPESQQIFTQIMWPHLIAVAWLHWLQFLCRWIPNIFKPSVHLAPS